MTNYDKSWCWLLLYFFLINSESWFFWLIFLMGPMGQLLMETKNTHCKNLKSFISNRLDLWTKILVLFSQWLWLNWLMINLCSTSVWSVTECILWSPIIIYTLLISSCPCSFILFFCSRLFVVHWSPPVYQGPSVGSQCSMLPIRHPPSDCSGGKKLNFGSIFRTFVVITKRNVKRPFVRLIKGRKLGSIFEGSAYF